MSTDYITSRKIRIEDLLDGRLEAFGVRDLIAPKNYYTEPSEHWCFTDGKNFLWAHVTDGYVDLFTSYAWSLSGRIREAISEAYDTEFFSEHEPQFWGFDTEEEWFAWVDERAKKAKEQEDEFYAEILKFLSDEPNGIEPGTIGEAQALIAKQLVLEDPGLAAPAKRAELMNNIKRIYDRDHLSAPF